jgi:hypothetical protein
MPGLRAYVQMLHEQLAGTGVHATSVAITASIGSEPRFEPETEWKHEPVY